MFLKGDFSNLYLCFFSLYYIISNAVIDGILWVYSKQSKHNFKKDKLAQKLSINA